MGRVPSFSKSAVSRTISTPQSTTTVSSRGQITTDDQHTSVSEICRKVCDRNYLLETHFSVNCFSYRKYLCFCSLVNRKSLDTLISF